MQRSPGKSFILNAAVGMCVALMFAIGPTHADTLAVQPEQLRISAANPVARIQFRNTSAEETTLNFDVAQWQQEGDREWLTPSSKLMVVPDRVTLQPGESAKVRVGLRLSGPWWEVEAFQILVTETSRIPDVGALSSYSADRRTTRPSSVPVFLHPPGDANPRVLWSFQRSAEGAVVLRALNNGKGHVRLTSANLLGPAGQSLHKPNMSDVLLPGGARSWELAQDAPAGLWHLIVDSDAGPMRAQLELEPDDSIARTLSFSP